jgi:hypothetical protein
MFGQLKGWALAALLALIGLMWGIAPGRTDQAPPQKKAKATKPAKESRAADSQAQKGSKPESDTVRLIHRLNQPIDLEGFDPGTMLKEALAHLSDGYDLTIFVDDEAFAADLSKPDVQSTPINLPKIKKLRLATVLTKLAKQVGGTFLVRSNYVEITTWQRAVDEVWGTLNPSDSEDASGRLRPRLPVVDAVFDNRPLTEALRELSDFTGFTVVVDVPHAGDQAQTPVTGTLKNVPLDTAVRLLANQAELKPVLMDNAIYVTTSQNADALQGEQERINASGLASPTEHRSAGQGM